ncbi:MAG: PBS lyase, partial [Moorea sp. SIO4A3]|nr:PBS lyase [Moorena sp. SIO4A3]
MPHRGNANRPKLFPTFKTGVTQCLCYLLALLVAVLLIVNGSHAINVIIYNHGIYTKETKPETELWKIKGIVGALDDPDPEVWAEALDKLSEYKLKQLKHPLEIPKDTIDKIAELLTYKHESDESDNQRKSVQSRVNASAAQALGEIGAAATQYAPQIAQLLTDSDSNVRANAAYALGQMGPAASKYAPQIAQLLTDSDWNVRDRAAYALEQMGVAKNYAPQIAKDLTDSDSYVRARAASALGKMGTAASKYVPQILLLLTDSDWNVRDSAASALGQMGTAASEYVPQIAQLLTDSDSDVRDSAASALGQMGAAASQYAPQIAQLLTDSDGSVRYFAVETLGQMGAAASEYAPQIAQLLTDSDGSVRYSAVEALGQMGAAASKYAPQIISLLTDSDNHVPSRAAWALGRMGAAASEYVPQILELLTHSDDHVRLNAAWALGLMGAAPSKYAPQILLLLTESDHYVRTSATYALGQMKAAPFKYAPQIAELLTDSDRYVRASASSALGNMGAAATQYAPKIAKLLTDLETSIIGSVGDSAAKALEQMAPLEVKDLLSVLNQVYWYQREAPRLRFLAYFLSGGEKDSLHLIQWLGSPKEYPHQNKDQAINHQEGLDVLNLFAQIWEPSQDLPKLRKDLERQIAVVVNHVRWKQADIDLLKQHYHNLKQADSRLAADVKAKIIALETQQRFLIGFKIWLVHVSGWLLLIIIYPRSPQVQGLIWDRKFRTIVGLGYISIALTWIPWLRYRLLAPFRQVLVADASLDSFDPQAYFPDSHVKITRATHTEPIQTAIGQLQS